MPRLRSSSTAITWSTCLTSMLQSRSRRGCRFRRVARLRSDRSLGTALQTRFGRGRLLHVPVWVYKDQNVGKEFTRRSGPSYTQPLLGSSPRSSAYPDYGFSKTESSASTYPLYLTNREPEPLGPRTHRSPSGDMAEYLAKTATWGVLRGICPGCESLINRLVSWARLDDSRGSWRLQSRRRDCA